MAERAERSPIVRAAHRRSAEAVSAFTGSSRSFQGQNPCHPDAEKDGGKNASNSRAQRGFFRRQEIEVAFGVVVGDPAAGVIMWKVELGETHVARVTPQCLVLPRGKCPDSASEPST